MAAEQCLLSQRNMFYTEETIFTGAHALFCTSSHLKCVCNIMDSLYKEIYVPNKVVRHNCVPLFACLGLFYRTE
jgi:hypothetical protein